MIGKLVDLRVNLDDRGMLYETLRADMPEFTKFGQVYLVHDFAKGIVRAFHRHSFMYDYFVIINGTGKFVLVEEVIGGGIKSQVFTLSYRKPQMLVVPPLRWHGWLSLEDNTTLLSIASEVYNKETPDEERTGYNQFLDENGQSFWQIKFK